MKSKLNKNITKTLNKCKEYAWRITIVFVVLLGAILIGRPLFSIIKTSVEIRALNREKTHYQAQINRDSTLIENLKNDEFLERYAREKYYMQGKGEKVFIVE